MLGSGPGWGLGILFILGIGTAFALYDRRVSSRFDYRFFSWKNFLIIALGTCLAFVAVYNAPHIRAVGTNPLSLFFALSAGCVMCWTLVRNFRHTGVLHGFLASALQIPTFSAIVLFFAPIGPAVLIVTVPLVVLPRIDMPSPKEKEQQAIRNCSDIDLQRPASAATSIISQRQLQSQK